MSHHPDASASNIRNMRAGDHCCGFYRTDAEHRALVVEFIRQGVERNEKILYIVNAHTAAALRTLLGETDIDIDSLVGTGQLVILTAKEAYLVEGEFAPERMVSLLREETAKALAAGYAALRVTGEMTWALSGEPGSERLIEYEARLNEFFPGSECYAICQYDLRRFDAEVLIDVLHTHPQVLHGTRKFDNENMYYVPPEKFLGHDRRAGMLAQFLDNLSAQAA